MNRRFYRFLCVVLGAWYRLFFPYRIDGAENIPAEGGFVLCANHCSNRDPFFLAIACKHRCFHFMAKAELFRWKPLARIVRSLGGFPVERGNSDLNSVRTALKLITDGHGLAIFPQGTRVKDNRRTPMLEGVSMIALRAGVPVIPAYIGGPFRLFHRVQISFGKPVDLSGFGRRMTSETLAAATRHIEDAVWSLKAD